MVNVWLVLSAIHLGNRKNNTCNIAIDTSSSRSLLYRLLYRCSVKIRCLKPPTIDVANLNHPKALGALLEVVPQWALCWFRCVPRHGSNRAVPTPEGSCPVWGPRRGQHGDARGPGWRENYLVTQEWPAPRPHQHESG